MTQRDLQPVCPKFERAFSLIGKRWTGLIIRILKSGKSRFTDIGKQIPHLSARMLSERLRELEHENIVLRIVHNEVPVRIEYELTVKGYELADALDCIQDWAEKWQ